MASSFIVAINRPGPPGLREEIRQGHLLGPRLLCAGQPLTAPKGHCHQWGGEDWGGDFFLKVPWESLGSFEHGEPCPTG